MQAARIIILLVTLGLCLPIVIYGRLQLDRVSRWQDSAPGRLPKGLAIRSGIVAAIMILVGAIAFVGAFLVGKTFPE
ncbi:MAG: hypothetical protein QOE70_724 [Chthoniobacter sp.]|jgi:hypothetical protein|nr:hypothetical protein [Chthoniobacter sp.]